jgi:subtilisin family serine protease
MSTSHRWGRRGFALLLASGLVAGVGASTIAVPTALAAPAKRATHVKSSPARTLGAHDADLLARAQARHEQRVTLIIATDKGRTGAVADQIRKLGGQIANRQDKVGYLRVSVPTAEVLTVAKVPGVGAVDLNESIPLPDVKPQAVKGADSAGQATVSGPGAGTPAANPYMPTNETGAVAFKAEHPTWDGRGVTIGILDSGVDLDNPALQTTSTGERKIVDWVTATDPVFDNDGTWRAMLTSVTGPTFTYAGSTWTAPAGNWQINRFSESITAGSEVGGDVNRDGDTTDRFGILYDPRTHDIIVDVNQNLDFTDDAVMRPYNERFDIGHFGTDNPATAVREQMPFVVQYREDVSLAPYGLPGTADFVNIGIVEAQHGSHVAGIAAANDMMGNPNFDGAAPGAKIVAARACVWNGGCTYAALTDGMVDLVVNRHVDVVNMSIGGLPALNDGNNARARLYNTLIADYGVQLIFSAGNSGPGVNTVGDPAVTDTVIAAAASVSKDTWLADYGSVVSKPNNLFNFSSRGPREDGGFKPNVSAPGAAISTTPLWQPGGPVPEAGYSLPPGLSMLNGTSMASPQTTGAAALLLSAARAEGRTLSPAILRQAIYSSALPIDGVPTHGQGFGMVNVPGAWKLVTKDLAPRTYTSSAPVCTPLSDYLTTPGSGQGIYNRCAPSAGGQRVGETRTYPVTITRTSGPSGSIGHEIKLQGNDGTFSVAEKVKLPLNQPVTVDVTATAASAGVHSAIMRVDDDATPGLDFQVHLTVIAAEDPTAPAYQVQHSGSVDRNSFTSYFVTVPAGAPALQVNLSGLASGSQTRFIAFSPWGVPVESTASTACYANYSNPATCNPTSRSYADPLPGVWEIEVESRRTSPLLSNPFTLTARVQGVSVEPALVTLPSVTAGVPAPVSWTLTNRYGPVTVAAHGGPLGSSASARPSISTNETQTYTVDVPSGASRLSVVIGNPGDPAADLDLYVRFNGAVVGQSADGDSEEAVTLNNPAAGTYTVSVVGYAVPSGTTAYDYRDVFYSPALGSVDVGGSSITLGTGGTATVSGTVTAAMAPAAGRSLFGEMTVVTDEGAVVGRGSVAIGSVN